MMINTTKTLHDDKVKSLAEKYRNEGFNVYIEPNKDQLPFDLGNYQPDIIATKDKSGLIIDVKTSLSRISVERLQAIAEEISTHPGWRFLVVTLEDIDTESLPGIAEKLPSWKELNTHFNQAQRLIENDLIEPAFLFLWSIFEGALRKRAVDVSIPVERLPVIRLLKQMYSLGELSISQFNLVEAYLKIRNTLAHGYLAHGYIEKPNLEILRQFESLLSELLDEWKPDLSLSEKIAEIREKVHKDQINILEIFTSALLENPEKKDEILKALKETCEQEGLTTNFNELQHLVNESYRLVEPATKSQNSDLINDGFIGMWSERQDLTDSNTWVRGVRENEWSNSHE